jgi:hypothetical protein
MSSSFLSFLLFLSVLGCFLYFIWGFFGLLVYSTVINVRDRRVFGWVSFLGLSLSFLVLGCLFLYALGCCQLVASEFFLALAVFFAVVPWFWGFYKYVFFARRCSRLL